MSKKRYRKEKTVTSQELHKEKSIVNLTDLTPSKTVRQHLVFLFILAFAVYANTLNNGFVLDDTLVILGNSFTQQGLAGLGDIWTKDMFVGAHGQEFELTGGRYRPLSLTIFAIEFEFFGKNAFVGHLTNILFFAFSGIFIYLTLLRLFIKKNAWIPLIATAIFIAHPIHTEVVANIKSLDEILALFFLVLSFYFMLDEKDSLKTKIISISFYLLALLSKENTITALAIIPLTLLLFRGLNIINAIKKVIPYLVIAIFYLFLREIYSGGFTGGHEATNLMDSPFLDASFTQKIATLFVIAGKYISLLFFPYPLSYDYSYNAIGYRTFGDIFAIISLIGLLAVLGWAIKELIPKLKENFSSTTNSYNENTIIIYGILFYTISYSIVSNFIFNIGTYMGERFVYMASLGFCIAIAGLLVKLLKIETEKPFQFNVKNALPLLIIIPLASFGTINRNFDWKDNYTLYQADIETIPNSARAQMFIGIEKLNQFYAYKKPIDLEKSIEHITKATVIYPKFYHAFYNLGLAYQAKKEHQKALESFEAVLAIQPLHINTHYYMGMSYGHGFNDTKKAIEYMEKGIKYGYKGKDKYVNLGVAYGMSGNFQKAIELFNKAAIEAPDNANVFLNLGITYSQLGKKKEAEIAFEKAYAIDPSLRKK